MAKNFTKGWNSSAASSYSMKSEWKRRKSSKQTGQQSFLSWKIRLEPTGRFLALEIAHQLDDVIHVVETLQLALVVDDLHGLFDDLVHKNSLERFRDGDLSAMSSLTSQGLLTSYRNSTRVSAANSPSYSMISLSAKM